MASVTIRGSRDPVSRKLRQEGQIRSALADEGVTNVYAWLNGVYHTVTLDRERLVYSPNLTRPDDAEVMTP